MREYRRRGVYIGPLGVILSVLAALLAAFLVFRLLGGGEPPDPAEEPDEDKAQQVQQMQEKPILEHAETPSGIACTRTELAEDAIYTGELILVNNRVLYRFPEEQELVSIYDRRSSSYYVKDMETSLAPAAMDALNALMDAFLENGGSKTINVIAGYRDADFQQHLFEQSARRNGQDHAEKYVAQPGGSEHHTGLAVDFAILYRNGSSEDYDGTGEYAWINGNCQNYGWVVRYETGKEALTGIWDEPWHFRYVGIPHAAQMAEKGLCLEEYIDYLKDFTFDGDHLVIDCVSGTYEVWYTQGTEGVYLPDAEEYAVSGNNVDGVIVTVKVE